MFFSSDTSIGQIREEKINAMAVLSEMAKQGKREPEHVFGSFPNKEVGMQHVRIGRDFKFIIMTIYTSWHSCSSLQNPFPTVIPQGPAPLEQLPETSGDTGVMSEPSHHSARSQ